MKILINFLPILLQFWGLHHEKPVENASRVAEIFGKHWRRVILISPLPPPGNVRVKCFLYFYFYFKSAFTFILITVIIRFISPLSNKPPTRISPPPISCQIQSEKTTHWLQVFKNIFCMTTPMSSFILYLIALLSNSLLVFQSEP